MKLFDAMRADQFKIGDWIQVLGINLKVSSGVIVDITKRADHPSIEIVNQNYQVVKYSTFTTSYGTHLLAHLSVESNILQKYVSHGWTIDSYHNEDGVVVHVPAEVSDIKLIKTTEEVPNYHRHRLGPVVTCKQQKLDF